MQKKIKEVEEVQIDFRGQTIREKIEDGVKYYTNPLTNRDEAVLINLIEKKIAMREERDRILKERNLKLLSLKSLFTEIRDLRTKIGEMEQSEESSFELY